MTRMWAPSGLKKPRKDKDKLDRKIKQTGISMQASYSKRLYGEPLSLRHFLQLILDNMEHLITKRVLFNLNSETHNLTET